MAASQSARDVADRAKQALANIRAKAKAAATNSRAVMMTGADELVGYASTTVSSYLVGYFGHDWAKKLGFDARPLAGLVLQGAGLGALLFGHSWGRWMSAVGRGPLHSYMAEKGLVAGARMALPADQRKAATFEFGSPGATRQIGADPIPSNHPAHTDVTFTRLNRL